jgi:hypothetical protein
MSGLVPHTLTKTLVDLVASAQSSYQERLREEKKANEIKKKEELEQMLMKEVEQEKRNDKHLVKLEKQAEANAQAIETKLLEKKRMQQLLEQATESDLFLECLRQEKEQIDHKAQAAAARALQNVLKRQSAISFSNVDLDDDGDDCWPCPSPKALILVS